ncbi:hypothetical protein HYC85_027924 [Camellia sinensis]|uniref:DUF4216 domain-containing protein n=1 Tax=Camellia sinensis TaxID=4442 RepID=A0A7J7FTN6_CAMSI|nr:hypothetical protein HYC85_027924 [Camellia sinensis]
MPRVDDYQLRREHFETFHIWFKEHVQTLRRTTDVILSEEIILLANGPHNLARRFNGYILNGFRYRVKAMDDRRATQNCGVALKADTISYASRKDKNPRLGSVYYYGQLTDIVEIRYSNEKKHVLFKCDWIDNIHGKKEDVFNFTLVNFNHLLYRDDRITNEPFILASQVEQVWYVADPLQPDWQVVVKMSQRGLFDMSSTDPQIEPYMSQQLEENIMLRDEEVGWIIMERKRKPDHPRRMMSDVPLVPPPLEEASHRPASEGPLVPPPSEGPLPPYRPPSVAPQQLPCTRPPRLPSVRPPSMAPQQLSSSAYEPSADPSTSSQPTSGHVSSSSTSTRRGRGCAKGIKEWGTGKKLHIQFDGNYCPIGDNVAKLTTQLGIIVRNGNIVPLTFVDWNSVPDDIVDAIWKDVKDNLNICPEEYKPICMKNCNSIWKDHKNKLKAKYFKPRSSDPNLKDDVPMNVVPSQWEQLVEYWRTSDAEKIASRNAKNRRAHGIAHTTGRTTFSQIRHEMTSKGESTNKMNVWLMTRRVDDPEVIQTLDEFNRQLSMLPEDGRTLEARNAIFHELIGHDRHGYCRTYGRIVPRRVVYKDGAGPSQSTPQPSTIDQITQQVRAELRDELREELRAEFSTHLQQMRAEMMALVSQGASVDPNRQVPDASSGHRAFRESAEDENPYTPPPKDQV